jgi:hypothetical protein
MYKHQAKWGYKIQKSFFLSPIFSHIEQTRLFFFLCLSLIKQKKRVFHHALVRNKTRDKKKKKIDFI